MALNPDRAGHAYPAYRYEVSREKVREYVLATGVSDQASIGDDGELTAPPTFAACFTVIRGGSAMFADPELGAHANLVHSNQEYVFHRPVKTGDVLECTPRIAAIRSRGRMDLLTIEIDCVEASSKAPVVTSRGVLTFLEPEA